MNRIILVGRLTKDIETRFTQNGKAVANFSLAVDRRFKNTNGEKEVDFINCVIWEKKAEILAQYCGKGSQIAIDGELQGRKWKTEAGENRVNWEVLVDNVQFLGSKGDSNGGERHGDNSDAPPQSVDSDLPF